MPMDDAHMTHPTDSSERALVPRAALIAFVAACAVCLLLPLVGMLWAPTLTTTENRQLRPLPELVSEEGIPNASFLSGLGSCFEDHFAYRNELVALNAYLRTGLFATSPSPSVVFGEDGRLYYEGTLGEYTGTEVLTERGADNVAFNLMLMQGYVESQGASFAFAIAPNKNSLYSQEMPYYEMAGERRSIEVLEPYLEERDVRSVDLFALFEERGEDLYYLRDSHWNTKGALIVSEALIDGLGRIQFDGLPDPQEGSIVDGYVGDLNRMLYPAWPVPEEDFSFEGLDWAYVEGSAVDDSWIETRSGLPAHRVIDDSLLMYRDSFANNLIPFLSTAYERAYYSKWVPYDLTQVGALGVRDVVIERAERHIADLNEDPAIMPAPRFGLDLAIMSEGEGALEAPSLSIEEDGPYYRVTGALPAECALGTEVYLEVADAQRSVYYVPFRVRVDANDFGFVAYLEKDAIMPGSTCAVYGIDGTSIIAKGKAVLEGEAK